MYSMTIVGGWTTWVLIWWHAFGEIVVPTKSFADYHLHAVAVYYHQGAVQQPIGLSLLLLLVLQPVAETAKL